MLRLNLADTKFDCSCQAIRVRGVSARKSRVQIIPRSLSIATLQPLVGCDLLPENDIRIREGGSNLD